MHQHLHIRMHFVELLDAVAEMIDQFPAFLGVESLEIGGDKDQCHRTVGAEQVSVDEGEAHAAGDVGHQALAQSQRIGGDQLGDHASLVVHVIWEHDGLTSYIIITDTSDGSACAIHRACLINLAMRIVTINRHLVCAEGLIVNDR